MASYLHPIVGRQRHASEQLREWTENVRAASVWSEQAAGYGLFASVREARRSSGAVCTTDLQVVTLRCDSPCQEQSQC